MYVLYVILGILVLLLIIGISINNGLIRKRNKVDEARSGIEVALTKRYDMLTKQLDVAKAYAKHEEDVFTKMVKMRQGMSIEELEAADASMTQVSQGLIALGEAYPELHSDTTYRELQVGIRDAEDQLQAARRAYNANVTSYNTALEVFPSSIIAGMKGMQKASLYVAEDYKREDVKMNF